VGLRERKKGNGRNKIIYLEKGERGEGAHFPSITGKGTRRRQVFRGEREERESIVFSGKGRGGKEAKEGKGCGFLRHVDLGEERGGVQLSFL